LVKDGSLQIDASVLRLAVIEGKRGATFDHMRAMCNKILEGVYSRQYMAEHSFSGRGPPTPKGQPKPKTKPGLPPEDVEAIVSTLTFSYLFYFQITLCIKYLLSTFSEFISAFWLKEFGKTHGPLERDLVKDAIQRKRATETRAFKLAIHRDAQANSSTVLMEENVASDVPTETAI
jgi:hypothetical protein